MILRVIMLTLLGLIYFGCSVLIVGDAAKSNFDKEYDVKEFVSRIFQP